MGAGRRRGGFVGAGIAALFLAIPAVAVAVANHLSINVPHKAKVGVQFNYSVSGNAAASNDHLATFLTTGMRCARTFKQELASPAGVTEVTEGVPRGHFTRFYVAKSRSKGTHHVCAFLYKNKSKRTVARATSTYRTH